MEAARILEIKQLKTYFYTELGKVAAVDGVSLHVNEGEILGVVGESGCGKSVTAQSVMRLFDEKYLASYEGEVLFKGKDILQLSEKEMRNVRGNDIAMIFQDPLSSLNPVYTIGDQIKETIMTHRKVTAKQARERAIELLQIVGIPAPEQRVDEYPHQLSGGMRQRVMIASALACEPKLLIADEPTTALDVTIQAQILELLLKLNREYKMSIMMITHDLGVVAEMCNRVAVMYLGQVVEVAEVRTLFENPMHPYTIGLMRSIPHMNRNRSLDLEAVEGSVPTLHNVPQGCRFASRCAHADDQCRTQMPDLAASEEQATLVRCWKASTIAGKGAMNG